MSRFEDTRFEVGLKILSRNDAYLANINNKSTILLTLSSAIIAAVALNYKKFAELVVCPPYDSLFSTSVVFSIVLFMASIGVSLYSIFPNIAKSADKNIVSFVDVVNSYDSEKEYSEAFEEEREEDLVSEIASLNFNLSKALVKKNHLQRVSVMFIGGAIVMLFLSFVVVVASEVM